MNLPERREPAIEGEVQALHEDPEICPIRMWEHAGPWRFRWECTGGIHSGNGSHMDEQGRRRGIRQHHDQVRAAREAGKLQGWRPV